MDDYRRPEASEHYERAIALERIGRIDEALVEYRRAIDVDPGFAEAHEALGYHYQRRGLLMKALDAFQIVARLEGHYTAYFNQGYILVELGRYEEALEVFQQCLDLTVDDPSALYEMGYIHYILGNLDQALSLLRIPLEVYGDDWRVHNLVGACNLGLRRWKEAEEHYEQALALAASADEIDEARAGIQVARRYREFSADDILGFKERAYADAGIVVLGTLGDDGLQVAPRDGLELSPAAVAVTMRRLQALVAALELGLTAVVAVDRDSIPLATALGTVLSVPRRQLSQLSPEERPLLVLLAGRQAELLQVAKEQAPEAAVTFVFALGWYGEHDLVPDMIGVSVKGGSALPQMGPALDAEGVQAAVEALLVSFAHAPMEPNQEAQVRYYVEKRHGLDL